VTIIPAHDSERGWRTMLFVLTGLTALVYLANALLEPGTLSFAPHMIQDDARQFLSWMSRLGDASAMPGDLLADYWQSVSPPFYRFIFAAANALGLEPTLFARLLPVALLFFCAWMAWRIALAITKRPVVAFVAAALVTIFVLHEDSIYSATPRAFSTPLFLLFLDGLLRDRGWIMIPALFLLGLLYPATALVALTMMGLSRIGWRPFRIDLSRRTWLLGALGVAAVGLAIIPFAGSTSAWEPTLNLEQALAMPNLGTAGGRSSVVGLSGDVDYLCSARMGLLPEIVPCWSTPAAVLPNLLLMVPMLLLAWRAVRGTRYRPNSGSREEPGDLVHAWALVAAIAWWAVAIAVAFQLHLPSRYTQRTLSLLEFLAIGQMLGPLLERRLKGRRRTAGAAMIGTLFGIFFLAGFATPTPGLSQPADAQAVARIAAMPPDTVIGGVSDQLDYLPALTGRPTLATIEHAIPYHSGYFTPIRERLEAGLAAVSSPDPAVLADYVRRYGVKVIAVDRALFEYGELPARWSSVVPDAVRTSQEMLEQGPPVLQRRAPACLIHDGALVLLDAPCLTRG
jgi:hypothetical protein